MRRQSGMTLIELLVAMVIGLSVTLVVASVLVVGENHKRTTTSTNDADQTGTYAFYTLNRALRGAGSSLIEGSFVNAGLFGCTLHVVNASNGHVLLPRAGAFPAPFAANFLNGVIVNGLSYAPAVTPLAIQAGGSDKPTSDAIVLMSGSGASGGVSRPLYASGNATAASGSLPLQTTQGMFANDLMLVSAPTSTDCFLEEVEAGGVGATTLSVGTAVAPGYYSYTAALQGLAASTSTYVTPIGNAAANNAQFEVFGVGTNNTLYSYDLLQNQGVVQASGGDVSQAIADGVIQMNAIYGVASLTSPALPYVFAHWASPSDAAHGYDIQSVMSSTTTMKTIISVRVAIVVRGEYYDKNPVSPATLTIFNGLVDGNGTALTKVVALPDPHYRYRVFEFTVPLRDMLVLAAG